MGNQTDGVNIKAKWLDARCLAQITKYAKLAHDYDGAIIRVQEDDVLGQVRRHISSVTDPELQDTYRIIKDSIRSRLSDPELSKQISDEAIPECLISGFDEERVSRKEIIGRWFGLN